MRKELIEKVAEAIKRSQYNPKFKSWTEDAEAALTAIKDAGYAVVPVIPNHDMIEAENKRLREALWKIIEIKVEESTWLYPASEKMRDIARQALKGD